MSIPTKVEVDFKSQFYNLQGVHINERKRNFNKLLKSTSSACADFSQDQFNIQPRNYLENIFYVDVLVHFRQVEKLIEILKQGIEVLSSRILKQKWFFQEGFKSMSGEDIVNVFLPSLSFSVRMKVLKKLSLALSEERMDEIFDLVLERYGIFIAQQFLFSCSSPKIVHFLENNEVTLSVEQLKRILHKDIEVLKVYFKQYKKNMKFDFNDDDFFSYLVWKYPNLYFELELHNRDSIEIQLGHYTTRAVINIDKEAVLNDLENPRWNTSALVKEIRDFDQKYLFQFFPKCINSLRYHNIIIKSFLFKYPRKKRWDVLCRAFKQAYKEDILTHLDKFEEDLASFFPTEIKQKWAEIKYLETDKLQYMKYYEPKKGFKLLKDKINVTSDINRRGVLLNELITLCYQNQDYSIYKEVLKYICVRHRNDDKNVRARMISHIAGHIDYNLLTEDHWQYLNEIIDIQRVRGETIHFGIVTQYLLFVNLKELPFEESVAQYIKDCNKQTRSLRLSLPLHKEQEGTILRQIVKIFPTLTLENEKLRTYDLMDDLIDYNKVVKNHKVLSKDFKRLWIDLNECIPVINLITEVWEKEKFSTKDDYRVLKNILLYNCLYSEEPIKGIAEDRILDRLKTISARDMIYHHINDCISSVIKKPKRNKFENVLLDYYFNNGSLHPSTVKYFLFEEPEVAAKHFRQIIVSIDANDAYNMLNYDLIKKYSHLKLDQQFISHFKNTVFEIKKYNKKLELLNAMATVMDTEQFLYLVIEYTPDEKKLDLTNNEQKEIYQLQCDIAKIFKKLDEPLLVAPVVMHYSQGDYFQSSLPTLYKVLYRISEENAFPCIIDLGERAVSVRKHAVFLGFELLSYKTAMNLYSERSTKETNVSAKKYLLDAVLKFFLKNPHDSLLDIVFSNLKFIDKNDTELIQTIVKSVNIIPNKYKPRYVEKIWNLLQILEDQDVKVLTYRDAVLHTINRQGVDFVLEVSELFYMNLIKQYFLPCYEQRVLESELLNCFVINYLLAYLDESRFEFVFNIIKTCKDLYWKSDKIKMNYVLGFFNAAYARFDKNDAKFLYLFKKFWQKVFSNEKCFPEYILLRLMAVYKENSNIEIFAKVVDSFLQELMEKYGAHINQLLIDSIKKSFCIIHYCDDFNLQTFALHLLKSKCSDFNCFVAFVIFKDIASTDKNDIQHKVVDILGTVNSGACRIYYNILLRKISV